MSPEAAIAAVKQRVETFQWVDLRYGVASRTPRAANELRNSSLKVLRGPSPSAPGSPPGVRSGHLRTSGVSFSSAQVFGLTIDAGYAGYLEKGTRKMAARPFLQKIQDGAMPKIRSIFQELGG